MHHRTPVLARSSLAADWKHSWGGLAPKDAVIGCDFSGTVVSVGSGVTNGITVGTQVAGVVHGGKFPDRGSFSEYLKADSEKVYRVPSSGPVTLREAPQFGVGFVTAAQVLYNRQNVPYPPKKVEGDHWYLVYGGSTSVGLFAIQLAKLAGYKVLTAASPHNFDLVKQYGADAVVDYKSGSTEQVGEQIRKLTNEALELALDCVSEGESSIICLNAFGSRGRELNLLLPPSDKASALAKEKNIKIEFTLAYTLVTEHKFDFIPGVFAVDPVAKDTAFYKELVKDIPKFITEYGIKPAPIQENGRLDDILKGFEYMQSGKVSGQKLHYKIAQ